MRRLSLMIICVVWAGAAFGQRQLTSTEVLEVMRDYGGGDWIGLMSQSAEAQTFILDEGSAFEIEVTGGYPLLVEALDQYAATGAKLGCNALEYGIGACIDRSTDIPYVYITLRYEGAIHTVGCSGGRVRGSYFLYQGSGSRSNPSCKLTWNEALSDAEERKGWQHYSEVRPWLLSEWRTNGNSLDIDSLPGITVMSEGGFKGTLTYMVDSALDAAQPSVADLQAQWGVLISGAYVDAGYGDGLGADDPGEPGDGGGTDWDGAPRDSGCRIFDLFCWARWAFVAQEEWPNKWSALRGTMTNKVPFGFSGWIPGFSNNPDCPNCGMFWGGTSFGYDATFVIAGNEVSVVYDWFGEDSPVRPLYDWWVDNMRQWLLWGFYAMLVIALIRTVMM